MGYAVRLCLRKQKRERERKTWRMGREEEREGRMGRNGGKKRVETEVQNEQTGQKQNTHISGSRRQIGSDQGSVPSALHQSEFPTTVTIQY